MSLLFFVKSENFGKVWIRSHFAKVNCSFGG